MSIPLLQLYTFLTDKKNNELVNDLKIVKTLEKIIYSDYKFGVTNYSYNDSLNNLIFFLLYSKVIDGYSDDLLDINDKFDRQIIKLNHKIISDVSNKLIDLLNDDKYDLPLNKKKINEYIISNEYNHELLLMIAGIYEINIFVFYKDYNIFKVYYPELKYKKNKKNIFLQYNTDIYSSLCTIQLMSLNNNFIIEWIAIESLIINNIQNIYSIGIEENKNFIIDDEDYVDNIFLNKEKMINISNIIIPNDYNTFDISNIYNMKKMKY